MSVIQRTYDEVDSMSKASIKMEKMFRERAIGQWNERIQELEEQLKDACKVRDDLLKELKKLEEDEEKEKK
jgi:hypothetical protein